MMNGPEKSDPVIVATKLANKAEQPSAERSVGKPDAAEPVERRAGTKGNAGQQSTRRTTEPGKRVTGAGTHTESNKGKDEGEVHHALPPHQRRPARRGVLRTEEERSTRRGSADVERLRGRPRVQSRGLAWTGPAGSVSGIAEPAGLHPQAGWPAAPARGRSTGGQDRPTGSGRAAERDLRGRLPR